MYVLNEKGGANDEENGNYSIVNGGVFFDRRSSGKHESCECGAE